VALPVPESGVRALHGARAAATPWGARLAEFMLVGGATLVLFPLTWLLRTALGLSASEYALGFATFYGAYVINDPHFSVTYLLFYKDVRKRVLGASYDRSYRIRYAVAGFVVPSALVLWAVAAITSRSAQALGWMVELMFFLVGWHYVKQGFGVLAILSARRGVRIGPRERTVMLFHCLAGWAYAWASPAAASREFEEKGVVYRGLGHPHWLELATGCVFAASTVALIAVLIAWRRRESKALPWAPLAGFFITIWSWTIYSSADRLLQYLIPALHSIQYLYFVWLMKRNEARAEEGPPSFGRPTAVRLGFLAASALGLGWLFFHGAPTVLDGLYAPPTLRGRPLDALGATPYFAAFFVIVNIHHYFMDHVIWRRENPETRYLREPSQAS
jgi:hypothetical protein